jgi:DNA uptake protein ComE-like DNA-binding protein
MLYAHFWVDNKNNLRVLSATEIVFLTEAETDSSDFDYSKSKYKNTYTYKKNYLQKFAYKTNKRDTVFTYPERKKNALLNLNEADSASLVALPKIGPVLAGRIVQYRNKLGGFHQMSQLQEVWGFKEDVLYDLEGKVFLNPQDAIAININEISLEDLKRHPYFKYSLSQALVNYRKQHGNFQSLNDLRKIKLVNDSIYKLISPYCTF